MKHLRIDAGGQRSKAVRSFRCPVNSPNGVNGPCPDKNIFVLTSQVVAFLPPDHGAGASSTGSSLPIRQWLLFDSHPRPQLGFTGASVQSFGDESSLAAALAQIFPAVDLDGDGGLTSMYNMLDCTPLMLKQTPSV